MGIKIFRDDNWHRITNGIISRKDIMHLDGEKDRELIRFLIAHAPEPCRSSMMEYAAEKYGVDEMPAPRQNIDDPNDPCYEEYLVLQEQVALEDNYDVLKEAALHSADYDMAAFAFCRLTGYSFPPSDCDAHSYRTYSCETLPGMTTEDVREFCQMVIEDGGPLKDAAKEWLGKSESDLWGGLSPSGVKETSGGKSDLWGDLSCAGDSMLYEIACNTDKNPDMVSIRNKAAQLIRNRDYQYALASHIHNPARTAMILNLYDSLEGDELFIARTVLTDPNDENKAHMLLYCEDEELLMLGWKYVYGARRICTDRLHAIGSRYPESYLEMDPQEKAEWEELWFICAGETALDLIPEDNAVRERLSGTATVDSEPLHFYLSLLHPRKAIRWWHARKLENQARIAYVGSWTSDEQIKEVLSVKIKSTALITEMIFGDLSAVDLVFGFRKPDDLTLQDRFCVEIMKNHPDRTIREHVRTELLRGKVKIPGVDLTKPDALYKGN